MIRVNEEWKEDIQLALTLTSVFWIVFLVDLLVSLFTGGHLTLKALGIRPRVVTGLVGIIASPFLHGNLWHLISNTIPFIILTTVALHFYRPVAFRTLAFIAVIAGVAVWILGRPNTNHIGASTVIFGLTAFLIASGFFRRDPQAILVAVIIFFLYGGIVFQVFPIFAKRGISWEGHLFGALAGVFLAYRYRNVTRY